jgi:hypothetical protein
MMRTLVDYAMGGNITKEGDAVREIRRYVCCREGQNIQGNEGSLGEIQGPEEQEGEVRNVSLRRLSHKDGSGEPGLIL